MGSFRLSAVVLFLLLCNTAWCQTSFSIAQIRSQLATAAPGAVFELPAGVHVVDSPLLLPTGVALKGAGIDSCMLLLDRSKASAFKYGFVVAPKASSTGVFVGGLTINGARTPTSSSNFSLPGNTGGGLSVGSNWTVADVRFTNLNYFKLWARNVSNVTVRSLIFEDLDGAVSGDNDNIGGGRIDSMLIDNCTVKPSAHGNGLDLMRSRSITICNSQFLGSPQGSHNVYLEAVTDSLVTNNYLEYCSISLQSDVAYSDTLVAVNPSRNRVESNTIISPVVQGISVRYDNATTGGGNSVINNTITNAGTTGIVILAFATGLVATPDTVTNNTVVDPFRRGTDKEWNTGYGVTKSAGITLAAGPAIAGANSIRSAATPAGAAQLWSGTQVGLRSTRKVSVDVQWVADDDVSGATYLRYFQPLV